MLAETEFMTQPCLVGIFLFKEEVSMPAFLRTSEFCNKTGIYRTLCCRQDVQLRDGQKFPVCPACRHQCNLILVHDLRSTARPAAA